jgi:hypothetical protein
VRAGVSTGKQRTKCQKLGAGSYARSLGPDVTVITPALYGVLWTVNPMHSCTERQVGHPRPSPSAIMIVATSQSGDSWAVTTTVDKYGHRSHRDSGFNSINVHFPWSFVHATPEQAYT